MALSGHGSDHAHWVIGALNTEEKEMKMDNQYKLNKAMPLSLA